MLAPTLTEIIDYSYNQFILNKKRIIMRGIVPLDPLTTVSEIHFAVVYVPRRNRKRFAANCVQRYTTAEEALQSETPEKKRYAARILGPSKSSEGQIIFYLVEWLGENMP